MVTLGTLRGQERVVGLLSRALAADRVAHAYLFAGPEGAGKTTAALALAAALNCDAEPRVGCGGQCDPCAKIEAGIHPDVRVLERQGAAGIIPIESVRREVVATCALPPHEGRARVFVIEEAGALQGPAANALLKTLEEPPPRTHFALATTAPDQLLPTIRSRCQRVNFAALPEDLRAELADDGDAAARLAAVADRLVAAIDAGALERFEAAREAAAERGELAPALRLLAQRLHAGARAAAEGGDPGAAALAARRAQLVLDAELAVSRHNAHGQLAADGLLSRLKEAIP